MTIGTELDQAFYNLGQRITRLEKKEVAYPTENDFADKETVLGIEADLTSQVERLESELSDRIDEVENGMGFDPDDLRCDFESQVDELQDSIAYESDRIDEIEAYKITEDEARDIAIDVVRDKIGDVIDDYVNNEVYELRNRVAELEARLNKPTLGARVLRWLREGPSIKEVATSWYAGIRRGS